MKDFIKMLLIALLILFSIGYSFYYVDKVFNKPINKVEICDTVYNKVTLDSIEYNIVKRDTIIYNIKTKMKDEVNKSKLIDDSGAVAMFNKLVTE